MKKTPLIILTLVASLALSFTSAECSPGSSVYLPEFVRDIDQEESDTVKRDTTRADSVRYNVSVTYDYYYRNPIRNTFFRWFSPHVYYSRIHQPGFVPRHLRPVHDHGARARGSSRRSYVATGKHPARSSGSSSSRGGFGTTGTTHSQFN